MKDILGKVFVIMLAMVSVLLITANISLKQDNTTQTYVTDAAYEFIDISRATGYISSQSYLDLIKKLDSTGILYDIEIVHKSAEVTQGSANDPGSAGTAVYYEHYYTSEILNELFSGDEVYMDAYTKYNLKRGDYLSVVISNKTPTFGNRLLGFLFRSFQEQTIHVSYGGYVGSDVQ